MGRYKRKVEDWNNTGRHDNYYRRNRNVKERYPFGVDKHIQELTGGLMQNLAAGCREAFHPSGILTVDETLVQYYGKARVEYFYHVSLDDTD